MEMNWYMTICLFTLIICVIETTLHKNIKKKKTILFLIISVLWMFAALRSDNVGADTRNYVALGEQLKGRTFEETLRSPVYNWKYTYMVNWEIGFKIIIYFFENAFSFLPARAVLGFISFVTLLFLYKAIIEQSPYVFLSIWLYITLAFYQTSLNMAQNAFALAIVLWAAKFVREKKPVYWGASIIFASLIHFSSIIFFPIYWFSKIKLNRKRAFWLLGVIGLMPLFSTSVIRILSGFVPTRYMGYLSSDSNARMQLAVFLVHIVLILIITVIAKFKKKSFRIKGGIDLYVSPYYLFFYLETVMYLLSLTATGFLRGATLFSPMLIIYIPVLISMIPNAAARKYCIVIVFLAALISYLLRMKVNNIGMTQPYSFYWENV